MSLVEECGSWRLTHKGYVGRWVLFVLYILFLLVFWLVKVLGLEMFFCLDNVILEIVYLVMQK